ncbi:hypothetical protein KUTeg_018300 [Tegillarca granosa]|uniref:GRAM domain-containing protein n=1 Tax=Tegillarca granosa TaxID=220873 RepID=A0ABQ9EHH4_TEGGR|nr:hypothetical protein KUTeg_018300 [Tegillarca granosa]
MYFIRVNLNTDFSCAFLGDILLQGSLYVSENWFCFHSKLPGRGRLLEIPMEKVISITREKTALIIPNAIGFQTAEEKYVFGSFISRDSTYKFLVSQWKKSQKLSSDVSLRNNSSISSNNEIDSSESDVGMCLDFETVNVQDTNKQHKPTNQKLTYPQVDPVIKVATTTVHTTVQTKRYSIPFFSQCFDFKKMLEAFITLSVKFQKIPRTNLLLAVCTIMVLFLLLSAFALTYKILLLQARLEAKEIWSSSVKS